MPLVRVEVRNEYGLGQPELYGHANSDDTKAVLDGVAVAGLVGILRQLGDLAEFAAEVFHGLQEQVMNTSSRSRKLRVRAQNIEAALPRLEKAMLAQTGHIHFAYSAGSDWHPHIRSQQNHFIYNDLPRFIMDNYEECRYPPSLHLLDKFDIGGPGSCLKRYSDPTFFKRASDGNDENTEKIQRDKKARKSKKKKLSRNGHFLHSESMPSRCTRMQFITSNVNGKTSPQPAFTFNRTSKSVLGTKSKSFDSRSKSNYNEFHFESTGQPEEESAELLSFRLKMQNSSRLMQPEEEELEIIPSPKINRLHSVDLDSAYLAGCNRVVDGDLMSSSFVTWDETTEILEAKAEQDDGYSQVMLPTDNLGTQETRSTESFNEADIHFDTDNIMPEIVKFNVEQDGSDKYPEILATDSHLDVQERVSIDYVKIDDPYISEPFPNSIYGGDQLNEIKSDTKDESPEMLAVDSNLDARESVSVGSIIADNTYISAPFPKLISVGDQPDGIESDTPDMLAINSQLDVQESGSVDNGIVVSHYVSEAFPKLIYAVDQPDEIESDADDKSLEMPAINSHLDVQDSGSVDHIKVDSPYISELFPKLISGGDQCDEIESDADNKSLEMLAIKSHLDVLDSGSVDHINADSSYISELFPKLISGGDHLDDIEYGVDNKSPETLAINSHLDLLDHMRGSGDHMNADNPYISELFPKLISGSDHRDEIESDMDNKSLETLAIKSHLDVQESGSVNYIEVNGPDISEAPNFISGSDQFDGIESDTDDYMDALNTIESESESDIDCQTKGEVQKHYSKLNNDAMDTRLHVFTVYPSDHHPFCSQDSKQYTASCISSDQGMSRHLCSSVCTEHEQLPETAGKSSGQQDSLVSCLASAEDPICLKSISVSSKPPPSCPDDCIALAPIGDEIITKFPDVDICDIACNADSSNLESFRNYSSAGQSAQASSESNIITGLMVIDYSENSDNFGSTFESFSAEPSSSSSFCSSQAPSIDKITTRSLVNICETTGNHDSSDFVSDSSIQLSPSPEVHSAQVSSSNKITTSLPVANGCQSSDNFGNLKFELVKESFSGSVRSPHALSGDKMIDRLPVDICENVWGLDFSNFESVGSSAVFSTQVSGEDMIITSLPVVANCENSDNVCSTFESVYTDPSFSCSTCAPQARSGGSIIVSSLVADISVSAGNPIHLKSDYSSTDRLSTSSTISNPSIIDIHESIGNPECSKFEADCSVLSSSSSTVLSSEATGGSKIQTNLSSSRETVEEFPDQPVKFWTNGGLLGLQPSKPPDFAVSHTARVESIAKFKDDTSPKNTIIGHKDDACKGEMDISVKGSKNTEKDVSSKFPVFENDLEDAIPNNNNNTFMENSMAFVDDKLEKNSDHHHSIILKRECAMNEPSELSSKVMPEAEMSDDPDVKITSTFAKQKDDANSFLFPGLTPKTTANGSQSKAPLAHGDDRSEPAGGHGSVACQFPSEMTSIHQLDYGFLVHSPSSSPPLEHMKISFQPTFGFEAPKLQLKFPDKSESHENIGDMFPSFQLVPEVIIPPDESGSNSDDDTFCRSSPYMSDEDLCHHSDSNSEQWELGETPQNMDHDRYDALHRICSLDVESISNSLEFEGNTPKGIQGNSVCENSCPGNGLELFRCGHLPELPSFDALNPLIQKEPENISSVDISRLQPPKEVPVPPPAPPLQCQTMKSLFNEAESRQDGVFDMKILESSISQHTRPGPAKKLHIVDETLILTPESKQGYLKFNIQTKAKHSSDGFGMDEKDFLQQIRARSFSLRPIAMAKSITSGPSTNTKVTAILEKANAIRQVVGSDDDDNWSDA